MKLEKIKVMVAVTLVGTIVYHKKEDSGMWQEPCVMQPLPDEGRQVEPIDERHIVSHAPASDKVKRIYWGSIEQFRVAESGIVRPKQQDVIDIGKSRGQ